MLVSLVRQALAPHRRLLLGLVAAQLVSVAASLYLPNLNADIVDHGVVRADTGYIWRTGGWMLLVSVVQQVQMLVLMGANLMVTAPIMMVGGVMMALHQDVGLSWLMVVAVPVLAVAIGLIVSRMVPGFRTVQERLDGVNRVMREHLSGIRVVRAFVREPHELQRLAPPTRRLRTRRSASATSWPSCSRRCSSS